MDKMKDEDGIGIPYHNNQSPRGLPINYPDMRTRDPMEYGKTINNIKPPKPSK